MQRNLSRLQKDELIKRNSGLNPAVPKPTAVSAASSASRRGPINTANYGYGERDDMIGFLAEGKKMKFNELPTTEVVVPQAAREAKVGKWEVTQIITKEKEDEEKDGVKKEESPEAEMRKVEGMKEVGKRERARTPDAEDLFRFRVEEKVFPVEVKDEDEVKVPSVGFKKRKVGVKNSRVSGAL